MQLYNLYTYFTVDVMKKNEMIAKYNDALFSISTDRGKILYTEKSG